MHAEIIAMPYDKFEKVKLSKSGVKVKHSEEGFCIKKRISNILSKIKFQKLKLLFTVYMLTEKMCDICIYIYVVN